MGIEPVDVLLAGLGAVALGAGALVVTTRHLVRAGLWLVVCLGAAAGLYLVLTAELVAWVQVLIYVGAVVVLLLFAVMLTRAPIGAPATTSTGPRWAGALVGGGAGLGLAALLVDAYRWPGSTCPQSGTAERLGVRDLPVLGAAVRGALGAAAGRPGRRDRAVPPRCRAPARADASGHPVRRRRLLFGLGVLRRAAPPQRRPAADGRRADAQRGQPDPGHRRHDGARRRCRTAGRCSRCSSSCWPPPRSASGWPIVLQLYRLHASVAVDEVRLDAGPDVNNGIEEVNGRHAAPTSTGAGA